jgi:cystathionine gamma-synthase
MHTHETNAIHAGRSIDPASGAVMPPIVLSTTFEREADGSYRRDYIYSRYDNPNRHSLEECLAALEVTDAQNTKNAQKPVAVTFASGLAAAMSVFHSLSHGDHVLAPSEMYFGVRTILLNLYERWGLQVSFVDMADLAAVKRAVRGNTKLIWTETPANPTVKLTDLQAVVAIAHAANALCVCDNTWTPLIQRPLELGCDMVMYSTTKYFGGHSDILSGAIIAKTATSQQQLMLERIQQMQKSGGMVPSPFDAWLLLRSISTLPHRLRAHSQNAQAVAEFLESHPAVAKIHYPGLASNPYHALARRQMSGLADRDGTNYFGGMLSMEVHGGAEAALALTGRMKLFTRATSLGGVESLIEHRASIEGPDSLTPAGLLRISVGLENADDLIADLAQALQ